MLFSVCHIYVYSDALALVSLVERLYCKRPIQCLASSKILTPTPHRPASMYPPPLVHGEDTLSGWSGGWGVNNLEDARHCSVLYICKYFVVSTILYACGIEGVKLDQGELEPRQDLVHAQLVQHHGAYIAITKIN